MATSKREHDHPAGTHKVVHFLKKRIHESRSLLRSTRRWRAREPLGRIDKEDSGQEHEAILDVVGKLVEPREEWVR